MHDGKRDPLTRRFENCLDFGSRLVKKIRDKIQVLLRNDTAHTMDFRQIRVIILVIYTLSVLLLAFV
jgi:hypothetical protein